MTLTTRLIQGTAAVLLARGAIKVVGHQVDRAKDAIHHWRSETDSVAGADIQITSGHRGLSFTSVSELPRRVVMSTGDLALDLAGVPVVADANLAIELTYGTLRLTLPRNQNWVLAWSLQRGSFTAGQEHRAGSNLVGRNAHTPLPGAPTLTLTTVQRVGLLIVR